MFLSPVPGSPANEEPPSPPSVAMQDYYPQAKFGFGQMSMSDGDAMMASPPNSRPRKQPKLGTPRTKGTPASCASTTTDICDSDGDVGDGVSDDEGDCGFSLRMPSGAGPARGLFGGGGGGAAMVDAPPAANVNPFAPKDLNRCDSVDLSQSSCDGGGAASAFKARAPAAPARRGGLFGGGFGQAAEPAEAESRFRHDFEVVKYVGGGSFGTVHKVKSRIDGCHYAVKATKHQFKGQLHRDRTLKEVFALAALSARDDAHEGIKHPGNVFLKGEATFKLGDFGLATQKQSGGGDVVEGDSRYMSRELLDDDDFTPASEKVDRDLTKCDVFSLGATAFELLKRAPLAPNGPAWHALRDGSPDFPATTPADLRDCVAALLHPNPVWRPTAQMALMLPQLQSEVQKMATALAVEKQHVQEYRADVARLSKQRLARSNTWA
ncbi:protein kinase [Aureococcus anophagefferens]|uniref:Protein kinase n=1 Tax=Aureococcus anophagefferens TaxID=44056 RepID=A0ABR1G7D6_AURAN